MARGLKNRWRFIDSPSLSPQENMRLDESLLASADEPIFRLYSWQENSFTIGRFQKIEEFEDLQRYGDSWAKRITGGGLLMHGFDLSYLLIVPTNLLKNRSVKQSYEYLCEFILNFYKNLGLSAGWAKDLFADLLCHTPFCQEGFEPYDIIIEGKKIGGNAQKRTKDFILQHGSIPLFKDDRQKSGYSLQELGVELSLKMAKDLLKESFMKTYGVIFDD